jgi:hypothetical protein
MLAILKKNVEAISEILISYQLLAYKSSNFGQNLAKILSIRLIRESIFLSLQNMFNSIIGYFMALKIV